MPQLRVKDNIIIPVLLSDDRKFITYDVVNNVATKSSIEKFKLSGDVLDVDNYALQYLFQSSQSVKEADFNNLESLNGQYALYYTFNNCSNLTTIKLNNLTTINGQYALAYCFNSCPKLTYLNLSSLTTASGSNAMQSMCNNCPALTEVDMSNLTVIGINSLRQTFQSCSNLRDVDLSSLVSIGSYGMYNTFSSCQKLVTADLSSLENITETYALYYTFNGCSQLSNVYLNNLKRVTGAYGMQYTFANCSSLTEIDLSSLLTVNADYAMQYCFQNCTSLTTVDLSGVTTINGQNAFYYTFTGCSNLDSLDFSSLTSISGSYPMRYMCSNCSKLRIVDFSSLTSIGDYGLYQAFQNCYALTTVKFDSLTNITSNYPFQNCFQNGGPTYLNLSNVTTATGIGSFYQIYSNSPYVTQADFSKLTTASGTNSFYRTFYNCQNLRSCNLDKLKTLNSNTGSYSFYQTFYGCKSLTSMSFPRISSSDVNITGTAQGTNPFYQCFYQCTGMTELHFHFSLEQFKNNYLTKAVLFGGTGDAYCNPNLQILFDMGNAYYNIITNVSDYVLYANGKPYENPFIAIPLRSNEYVIYKDGYCLHIGTVTPTTEQDEQVTDLNVTMVQTGDTYNVTTDIDTSIKFYYNGMLLKTVNGRSASILVPSGTEITYKVSADGYHKETGTLSSSSMSVSLTMTETVITEINMVYPFNDSSYQSYLTNLVDSNNFIISSGDTSFTPNMQPSIVSGPKTYHIANSIAYGYIEFTTPDTDNSEYLTLSVTPASWGESSCDQGWVYINTSLVTPTLSEMRTTTPLEKFGTVLFNGYGNNGTNVYTNKTFNCLPNTTYYLQFAYSKDGSADVGWDRLSITNIKFYVEE